MSPLLLLTVAVLSLMPYGVTSIVNEYEYLMNYGYMSERSRETGEMRTGTELKASIRRMQSFAGIPETGYFDQTTLDAIQKPRCGVRDVAYPTSEYLREDRTSEIARHHRIRHGRQRKRSHRVMGMGKRRRLRRYAMMGNTKWESSYVTYSFRSYPKRLTLSEVKLALRSAFDAWSSATNLRFVEVLTGAADILINFRTRVHGDPYPFDGPGHVLAHAFSPGEERGGDIHFDDDEQWINNQGQGSHSLGLVAIHEIGHSLGLDHSRVKGSTMFPIYQHGPTVYKLHKDDIEGIQHLYGYKRQPNPPPRTRPTRPPTTTTTRRTRPTRVTPPPQRRITPYRPKYRHYPEEPTSKSDILKEVCSTGEIDVIANIRRELFIFKDDVFWRRDRNGLIKSSSPTKISSFWYKIPHTVKRFDAVYERVSLNRYNGTENTIVIFSGNRYWILVSNNKLARGFPEEGRTLATLGLPVSVTKVDTVFTWRYNKKTYIIVNDMYWRLNNDIMKVEKDYPRDMRIWEGVPIPVVSSFNDEGTAKRTYFLSTNGDYYLFNDALMRVHTARDGYPRKLGTDWLDCDAALKDGQVATPGNRTEKQAGNSATPLFGRGPVLLTGGVLLSWLMLQHY